MKMKPITFALLALIPAILASPILAEKINMSPVELRRTATHVIVGTVVRVYERNQTTKEQKFTHYVAEIRIKEIDKGEGLKNGDLLYARYWTSRWLETASRTPGPSGHRGLPAEGETLRVYLARNAYDGFGQTRDGGFNVIGANGFEKLRQERKS
jgi:hypothetical protein